MNGQLQTLRHQTVLKPSCALNKPKLSSLFRSRAMRHRKSGILKMSAFTVTVVKVISRSACKRRLLPRV